jgi:integrase
MPRVFRQQYTRPSPEGAQRVTVTNKKGESVPAVRFKGGDGKTVTAPVVMKGKGAGRTCRVASPAWYGKVKGEAVPLCTNKAAAEVMLAELVRKAGMAERGLVDPFEAHRKRPLLCARCRGRGETDDGNACDCPGGPHLADFRRYLVAKGNTEKHARQTCRRAAAVLDGCNAVFVADVSPSAVIDWLATERGDGRLTIQTSNYYLRDLKSFCRWLVKDRRTGDNPLAHLSGMNAAVEDHRERRHLAPDDFAEFIEAARKGKTVRRVPGPDRAMLYTLAAYTGLRESELGSLTPESFDLAAGPPTVTVEAGYSKRRREDTIVLRADLADLLRGWLQGRPAGQRLWPGGWWQHGAKMVRKDLEAARAAWVGEAEEDAEERRRRGASDRFAFRDAAGRFFDFHALRHQFISNLAAAGVHPKVAQSLARHSTITLTMNRYTHLGLHDEAAALDKLPQLPAGPRTELTALKSTGTDGPAHDSGDKPAHRIPLPYTPLTQTSDSKRESVIAPESEAGADGKRPAGRKSLKPHTLECERGQVRAGENEEAPPGFEPGMADLQSAALPLG